MAAPTAEQLGPVEARLRAILEPYASRLETASIYSIPTLRRPGARAHDWFAFVKPEARHVSFYLLPMLTFPELMADVSPALARRRTGKSVLRFTEPDDALFAELEGLVARAFDRYVAARRRTPVTRAPGGRVRAVASKPERRHALPGGLDHDAYPGPRTGRGGASEADAPH